MMEEGPLAGFPVLDVGVELYDGGFHAVDSSAIAFELAAKGAFRQSMPKAAPQLIEPIMKVDVFTPEDNVGDVIGDLNRRRGMIKDQEPTPTGIASRQMCRWQRCLATSVTSAPLPRVAVSSRWSSRTTCHAPIRWQRRLLPRRKRAGQPRRADLCGPYSKPRLCRGFLWVRCFDVFAVTRGVWVRCMDASREDASDVRAFVCSGQAIMSW